MITQIQKEECARLRALFFEKAGMSQSEFCRRYNFGTPANLGQYLLGRKALGVETATKFARALKVSVADFSPRLADKIAHMSASDSNIVPLRENMKRIPMLGDIACGVPSFTGNGSGYSVLNGDYIYVDEELDNGCFAFKLKGDSMLPQFSEGDTIVIDPHRRPVPGDFVVANRIDGEEVLGTFKKYKELYIDSNGRTVFELIPLNPDFPTLKSDVNNLSIEGVMVEHRRRY